MEIPKYFATLSPDLVTRNAPDSFRKRMARTLSSLFIRATGYPTRATDCSWTKKDLIGGTLPQEPEDGSYPVLTVFDKSNSLTVGDTIQLEDAKLTVVG